MVAVIKSKYHNKIDTEREMRFAIPSIAPRFDKMCIEHKLTAHTKCFSVFCILNKKHDFNTIF